MGQATRTVVFEMLTGEDEGRVCRDIPETACHHQAGNFLVHVIALAATKTGDGLSDPKLVLSWLLTALGSPAGLIALLVPVREAGALLPQLVISASIRRLAVRKWVWTFGSLLQGLCVIGMAVAALGLSGAAAGWTIIGLLAVFAVARSLCSVSYKDVLGKTVSKSTRGTATGSAATVAAALVLLFGLSLSLGWLPTTVEALALVLLLAGLIWLSAAAIFASLSEEPGATEGGGNPLQVAVAQFGLLASDVQLRRFILTRALLVAVALGAPFLLALAAGAGGDAFGVLGQFVVASSVAALLSSYLWGRLSDRSSRRVLILAGVIGAAALAAAALLGLLAPAMLARQVWLLPGLLFLLKIAHEGVRLGRATHIVDMAAPERRAAYTALSNTLVGLWLAAAGAFGLLAQYGGITAVLGVFALMSLAGAAVAAGLDEVQAGED